MIPAVKGVESASEPSRLSGKMIVAREEAIYVVGAEGREMTLAFEGEKRFCAKPLATFVAKASSQEKKQPFVWL